MEYLNSLETYYIVGGEGDDDEQGGYGVQISADRWVGGAEEFFERHPEFSK